MPPTGSMGDPSAARVRRTTKARTFRHGTLDPVIERDRPLFTPGLLVLLAIMLAYGLYATGHLPQVDTFLDSLNNRARAKQDLVVGTILRDFLYIVVGIAGLLSGWIIFLYINQRRRHHTDTHAWDKEAPPSGPDRSRPILKSREPETLPLAAPPVEAAPTPAVPEPVAAKADNPPAPTPNPIDAAMGTSWAKADAAKAEAIAAAAKAEAAASVAPADLPSFVLPANKAFKLATPDPTPAPTPIDAAMGSSWAKADARAEAVADAAKAQAAADAAPADLPSFVLPLNKAVKLAPPPAAVPAPVSLPDPAPEAPISPDAAIAAALANAEIAAAQAAVAKAELAAAQAKAEAARALAALAAAKAAALNTPKDPTS